jgi:pimeloyl-ACP methyl ester carboxylesterase
MLQAFASGRVFGTTFGSEPPWVLAMHGWRRSHRDFATVLEGLDAVAVDLPGFGATPPPEEVWGGAEYAAAVAGVLDGFDRPAVVLGHSFGGQVAVHLSRLRPDAVRALVLTGVPLFRRTGGGKPPLGFRVARALHRRRLLGDARMEALRQKHGSADYRAATGVMRDVFVRVVNEPYDDLLRDLTVPVELVWADDDSEVPLDVAQRAAAVLPDARVTVVPGAGHLLPLTAPDSLRDALLRHQAP